MIDYCGTHNDHETAGQATKNTMQMKLNITKRRPVRVLRSCKLQMSNPYRPSHGFRYDGVYDVIGFEVLDGKKAMHRFKLVRQPGQDAIRYQGLAARPTAEDVREYELHRARTKGWSDL